MSYNESRESIWSCILRGAKQILLEWDLKKRKEDANSGDNLDIVKIDEDTEYLNRAAQHQSTRLMMREPLVDYDLETEIDSDRILLNEQIGKIIKKHRDEKRLSQEALGILLHTNRKRIGNLESGQCEVTVAELIALSKIFGCNPWDLCPREVIYDSISCPPEIREAVRTLNRWIEPAAG